ncbi:MAG: ATP-dependent helicase HrpB [Deltaproteobacteria bacterium]|nr:ATP-dependent helicase HrpB [Deltaproteobacteria bacterium]
MLPIEAVLPTLVETLSRNPAVVLKAPPGAGKTTRVPFAILDGGLLGDGELVMLEPRRMAARAGARVMARMRGERVGATIGYKVRFDERHSKETRISIVTEGILTRRFLTDSFLEGVSCVILDEFHERSVHADLCLAFVRELLEVREDLLLVVMSATIDTRSISRFLNDCPVIVCEGRQHPLDIEHIPKKDERPLHIRASAALSRMLRDDGDDGDVLVFLPGAPEIRRLDEHLSTRMLPGTPEIIPLYGALSEGEQDKALTPGSGRRVVLATNIAETSLTIPSVTSVVDTGLVKLVRADPRMGLDRLETARASKQSATQRAGRAGRTAPGRVLRLWTEAEHGALAEADQPEIRRVDLAPVLLEVLAFHPGNPRKFRFFESPSDSAVDAAMELLTMLGVLREDGESLSDRGKALAALPLHPRVGAILVRAVELDMVQAGALCAALIGERDFQVRSPKDSFIAETTESDIEFRMELLVKFEHQGNDRESARRLGLHFQRAKNILRVRDQLIRICERIASKKTSEQSTKLSRLLLAGFPDRVCRRRSKDSADGLMVGGRGVSVDRRSGVRERDLFIALEADAGRRGERSVSRILAAHRIEYEDLEAECPSLLKREDKALYDPHKQSVYGVTRVLFANLVVKEKPSKNVDEAALTSRLAAEASEHFAKIFTPDNETEKLIHRLSFAARVLPEKSWPGIDHESLKQMLPDLCFGRRSFAELKRIDWKRAIESILDYELRELLEREIPERLRVPSGSHINIDYSYASKEDGAPVLAVRLQEMFGLGETPRIARGRAQLLIHLLAPNGRPAQVTSDLKSFWDTTYPEVRKELKGRYPKHYWPEDPWTAQPTRHVRPRK